jgi:phenylalanyl-tRNA synthetase beta chain
MQSEKQLLHFFPNTTLTEYVKIKNPLFEDWTYMRLSLIPSLLPILAKNQSYRKNLKLFELSHVYQKRQNDLPRQVPHLTIVYMAHDFQIAFDELQGLVSNLLVELRIKTASFVTPSGNQVIPYFQDGHWLKYEIPSSLCIGEINQKILSGFGVKEKVVVVDVDFNQLAKLATKIKTFQPIPKYPPVIEDLTFVVPMRFFYSDIVSLIRKTNPLIAKIKLVDRFRDKLTFRIHYQDPKKSLTDQEVAQMRKLVVGNLESKGLRLVGKV